MGMLNVRSFEHITLSEMDKVKLMNRVDRKYWFNSTELQKILDSIHKDYYILQIEGEVRMPYTTSYFDTFKNEMYTAHHNGKLNRYKIRKRQYMISGTGFLEVKFKNNKGRTIKKRIPSDFNHDLFSTDEDSFIRMSTPYKPGELKVSLKNKFSRLTLVNKNFKERCTIDLNIRFDTEKKHYRLDDLVVVEVKTDGNSGYSPLVRAMRDHRHKNSGFSKYVIGRSITDHTLKRNAFKDKLRMLEKILKSNMNLF